MTLVILRWYVFCDEKTSHERCDDRDVLPVLTRAGFRELVFSFEVPKAINVILLSKITSFGGLLVDGCSLVRIGRYSLRV